MKNTRHKNQQGTRNLSACKIGMKFLDSTFVKKDVVLRTLHGNQGACCMFSGSPNCFSTLDVTPLVIIERSISIGSRALSRAVLMIVMARATFTLPSAVMFPKVIFRKITAFLICRSAKLFVGFTTGYLRNTKSSFLNFISRLRILSDSWCDKGTCRYNFLNLLMMDFLAERYSSGVKAEC